MSLKSIALPFCKIYRLSLKNLVFLSYKAQCCYYCASLFLLLKRINKSLSFNNCKYKKKY